MNCLEDRLELKLSGRRADKTLRSLGAYHTGLIDFSSNDYLGLTFNPELSAMIARAYAQQPISNGSGGSRLISGNSAAAEELEEQLGHFFKADACLLFNSGYTANLALLSSIPQKSDTIVYDELAHACIKDGARLSLAKRFSFKHNDLESLRSRLTKASGQVFVVVESVYSMDGDAAPLTELNKLCREFGAALIVDEAHSTGLYEGGRGLVCALGLEQDVFARVHTFGKAVGSHGACVAGSPRLKEYLINYARPFIYTTAMPLHGLISLQQSFRFIEKHQRLQEELQERITFFNQLKNEYLNGKLAAEFQIESHSPIQAIVVPETEKVKALAVSLQQKGYDVRPILSPTVQAGKERLRICLHSFNTKTEIERLVTELTSLL